MTDARYCPTCETDVTAVTVTGLCMWCSQPTARTHPGFASRITDAQLRVLYRAHVEMGASVAELGKRVHEQFGYLNPVSCSRSISSGWRRLGLKPRTHAEAVAVAGLKRRAPGSPGRADKTAHKRWQRARDRSEAA